MKKLLLYISALATISTLTVHALTVEEARDNVRVKYEEYSKAMTELVTALGDESLTIGDSMAFTNGAIVHIENVTNATATDFYANEVDGQYIKIDFTIENTSSEQLNANSHMFSMYDAERVLTPHTSQDFFSADIAPGMKAQGSVYYDIDNGGVVTLMVADVLWQFDTNEIE